MVSVPSLRRLLCLLRCLDLIFFLNWSVIPFAATPVSSAAPCVTSLALTSHPTRGGLKRLVHDATSFVRAPLTKRRRRWSSTEGSKGHGPREAWAAWGDRNGLRSSCWVNRSLSYTR